MVEGKVLDKYTVMDKACSGGFCLSYGMLQLMDKALLLLYAESYKKVYNSTVYRNRQSLGALGTYTIVIDGAIATCPTQNSSRGKAPASYNCVLVTAHYEGNFSTYIYRNYVKEIIKVMYRTLFVPVCTCNFFLKESSMLVHLSYDSDNI